MLLYPEGVPMHKITVLTLVDRIACFYTLSPFFNNTDPRWHFTWTDNPSWCLTSDHNDILIMVRQFIKPDRVDHDLLRRLRAKYTRIAFFHDDAGGGIPRLDALPYVDLFYQKALYRDRSLYMKPLYGKELYSDYFHRTAGVTDPDHRDRPVPDDPAQLEKLRLSWNIGVGEYPRRTWRQRIAYKLASVCGPQTARLFYMHNKFPLDAPQHNFRPIPVHARIDLVSRPSIAWHRKLILERIAGNPDFLVGMVDQRQYNRETSLSRIVLSPFGWGELCLRDFEAVRSGALLLKPEMSHLETWPDVFTDGLTCATFKWDGSDLVEKASYYLKHEDDRMRIVCQASTSYKAQLDSMQTRFNAIMKEITTDDSH